MLGHIWYGRHDATPYPVKDVNFIMRKRVGFRKGLMLSVLISFGQRITFFEPKAHVHQG